MTAPTQAMPASPMPTKAEVQALIAELRNEANTLDGVMEVFLVRPEDEETIKNIRRIVAAMRSAADMLDADLFAAGRNAGIEEAARVADAAQTEMEVEAFHRKHDNDPRCAHYEKGAAVASSVADLIRDLKSAAPEQAPWVEKASIRDVIAERRRQVEVEGWAAEHDAKYWAGCLAKAGALYARHMAEHVIGGTAAYSQYEAPEGWPWDEKWWKPKNPRRDLVRAAALIIAEIDRWDALLPQPAKERNDG